MRYAVASCAAHDAANPVTAVANAIGATKRVAPLLMAPTRPVPAPFNCEMRLSVSARRCDVRALFCASPQLRPAFMTPKRASVNCVGYSSIGRRRAVNRVRASRSSRSARTSMRTSSTEIQKAGSIDHLWLISTIAGLLSPLPSTPAACICSAAGPR